MNKTDAIAAILSMNPDATHDEIISRVGCTRQMINYVKRNVKIKPISKKPKGDSVVGFFTDTHEPACHPCFFDFVRDTFKEHGVTQVVCGGDLIDHHFISRHVSETDAMSPLDELDLAIANLKKWHTEFPEVLVCSGNHDEIPSRRAKELGIPKRYIRNLNDIYELPAGWQWAPSHEIDGVLYEHGLGAGGMYGFKNLALAYRQSVCVGHTHSYGGVLYVASKKDIIFGLNGGCGIDIDNYAARYGSAYKFKPTLGCGIIRNGVEAAFIPMNMDKYKR